MVEGGEVGEVGVDPKSLTSAIQPTQNEERKILIGFPRHPTSIAFNQVPDLA